MHTNLQLSQNCAHRSVYDKQISVDIILCVCVCLQIDMHLKMYSCIRYINAFIFNFTRYRIVEWTDINVN